MPGNRNKSGKALAGYSFAEVILAAFVLVVGIGAAYGAITAGVRTSQGARDIIVASGLAQEGIELIINVRDNAYAAIVSGAITDVYYKFPAADEYDCRIDLIRSSTVFSYRDAYLLPEDAYDIDCTTGVFDLVVGARGFWVHPLPGDTVTGQFKRRVFILGAGTEYRDVYSIVYWGDTAPGTVAALTDCTRVNKCVYAHVRIVDYR